MGNPFDWFQAYGPATDGPPLTLADARRAIDGWGDLTTQRRANLKSALSGVVRLCGLPENGIAMDCPTLNTLLFQGHPAARGFSKAGFAGLCRSAKFILRRLGRHAPKLPKAIGLTSEWKAVHQRLGHYRQMGLIGFMGFCSRSGIAPSAVDPRCLDQFELYLNCATLCGEPAALPRRIASNWNWAGQNVPDWPQAALHRTRMRQHLTLPLDRFPSTFQAEAEAFLADLAEGEDADDIYGDDVVTRQDKRRPRRPLRPRTVAGHCDQIRRAAAALIQLELATPDDLTGLRDLVVPFERAKRIRQFYRARHSRDRNSPVAHVLDTLGRIAQWPRCRLPDEQVDTIRGWAHQARPKQDQGMTEKNRMRLAAIIQPEARAMLQHLPEELLTRQATAEHLSAPAAARQAAYAIALQILLVFPMRRNNLAGLRLDRHLQWHAGPGQPVSHIYLFADEVKGAKGFQWPLPPKAAGFIELYLKHHRPQLAAPGNPYLFPGPGLKGRSAHELAIGLCTLIGRTTGLTVNIHLLRHFAGWIYLTRNPGAYAILQKVLGHADVRTTMNFYAGLEVDAAVKHFDKVVLEDTEENRDRAQAAFRKRAIGRRRRSK